MTLAVLSMRVISTTVLHRLHLMTREPVRSSASFLPHTRDPAVVVIVIGHLTSITAVRLPGQEWALGQRVQA